MHRSRRGDHLMDLRWVSRRREAVAAELKILVRKLLSALIEAIDRRPPIG